MKQKHRFLTKGISKQFTQNATTPEDLANTLDKTVSPIELNPHRVKHNSLKPKEFKKNDKQRGTVGTETSKQLSLRMIEDEFRQDRRASKMGKELNNHVTNFLNNKDGKLTPTI